MIMTESERWLDRAGVAALLGVTAATVSVYRSRTYQASFPKPAGKIGGSPYWDRETIEAWAAARPGRTGRPRSSRDETPGQE